MCLLQWDWVGLHFTLLILSNFQKRFSPPQGFVFFFTGLSSRLFPSSPSSSSFPPPMAFPHHPRHPHHTPHQRSSQVLSKNTTENSNSNCCHPQQLAFLEEYLHLCSHPSYLRFQGRCGVDRLPLPSILHPGAKHLRWKMARKRSCRETSCLRQYQGRNEQELWLWSRTWYEISRKWKLQHDMTWHSYITGTQARGSNFCGTWQMQFWGENYFWQKNQKFWSISKWQTKIRPILSKNASSFEKKTDLSGRTTMDFNTRED